MYPIYPALIQEKEFRGKAFPFTNSSLKGFTSEMNKSVNKINQVNLKE